MASNYEQKSPPSTASGQPSHDGMAAAHQVHAMPLTLEPIVPGFDPTCVRCAAESRLRELIFKDEDLLGRLKTLREGWDDSIRDERIDMLAHGYRVSPAITPRLSRLGVLLTGILRINLPMDMFVLCDEKHRDLNASCSPSHTGKRLVMCLNSILVDSLSQQELLFVMGHEAGHALLGHTETPNISFDNPNFSPLEVIKLLSLSRAMEVSCDRLGLLACQDVRVAGSALFKISTGLAEKWISFDESAYAKQAAEIGDLQELVDFQPYDETHPYSPCRVKALIAFAKSDAYAKALGGSGAAFPAAEMEKAVDDMLSAFDLTDVHKWDDAKEQEVAEHFIVNGALMLIAADGVVAPEKIAWLKAYTKQTWSREELAQRMAQPDFQDQMSREMGAAAEILTHKLSEYNRAGVLHAICDAAMCGGSLPHADMDALGRIRGLLDIREEIAADVLEDSEKEHAQAADNTSPSVASKGNNSTVKGESPQPASENRSRIHRSDVSLADLVSKGSVALSDTLFATYKGESYVATLKKDGANTDVVVVVYNHKPYDSVTAAAVAVTGKPVSGWEFWNVRSSHGKEKGSLKELRDQ